MKLAAFLKFSGHIKGIGMIAALLLLAPALAPSVEPSNPSADAVGHAQASYRACIASVVADRPRQEVADVALAAALERCRDAEASLRRVARATPDNSAARTLALVLDARLEGEEEGLRRREIR